MLKEIMDYLHNYFVPICAKRVEYTISDGKISPDFGAEDGDRFMICGSRRNDGVYTWHADVIGNDDDERVPPSTQGGQETIMAAGLRDETFAGTIRVCSVPPALLALSEEISQWVEANSAVLSSPMQSESFNGYSYTLRTGGKTNRATGGTGPLTWRDQFGSQLEIWRKPSV